MSDQQPPPPPPPYGGYPGGGPSAADAELPGLGKRFLARLLDGLLVGLPVGAVVGTFGLWRGPFVSSLIVAAAHFGYFVWMEGTRGQTVGKQVLQMHVVRVDGQPMDADAAMRRNWWLLLGIVGVLGSLAEVVVVIVIVITILSDARGEGFHDRMAGTIVLNAA